MEFTGERLVPTVKGYDDLFLEHVSRYMFASSIVGGKTVLDMGCGCGYGSYHLARSGAASVLGIDLSEEAIEYCRNNYTHEGLVYKTHNILDTGLEDESFDTIVSFEVFEHVDSPERLLSEVKRLLKPEGVFVVSTPNVRTYVAGGENGDNIYHVKEYTPEEFQGFLAGEFPRIYYYSQSHAGGQAIVPAMEANGVTGIEAGVRLVRSPVGSTWGESVPMAASLEKCAYMIALCRPEKSNEMTIPGAGFYSMGEDLGGTEDRILDLVRHNQKMNRELDERGRWAHDLQKEIALRDETIKRMQKDFEERTNWALELDRKVEEQAGQIEELRKGNVPA